MSAIRVRKLERLELAVADLDASLTFYVGGLGFEALTHAYAGEALLRLGAQTILLRTGMDLARGAAPVSTNDPGFQHFAIVVTDMAAAQAQVAPRAGPTFSRDGPQRLPPENGGVTAWKFRDPDGHPLELLQTSAQAWTKIAERRPDALFLGIDHTALVCADLAASLAFYTGLGFRSGAPSHNRGPAQDRLDGLEGVDLRIATLFTPEPGLHIELLHYSRPLSTSDRRDVDGDFIRTTAVTTNGSGAIRDPNGHRMLFAAVDDPD